MPQFLTKQFGLVPYEHDATLEFPAGLPGFETEKLFVAIEQPRTAPIVFLQSLASPGLCFITLPVLAVSPDYRLSISSEDLRTLLLAEDRQPVIGSEVLCLAIVSVAENRPATANLLAPVVVNLKLRRALQAIQGDGRYSHRHVLADPAREEAPCS